MKKKNDGKGKLNPNKSCIVSSTEDLKWNEGRRIVDIAVLAEGLERCSDSQCSMPLSLKNIACVRQNLA